MIVVGNIGVGKSSIVSRFVDGDFDGKTVGTVGIDFKDKEVEIDNKTVNIQIWDTAGEERHWTIPPAYCRKADGVILIYDITNSRSFDSIVFWKDRVIECSPNKAEMMILGNKLDLEYQRAISEDSGRELTARIGSQSFYEVSALTGENIEQAFESLAELIVKKKEFIDSEQSGQSSFQGHNEERVITVSDEDDNRDSIEPKSSSCCSSTPRSN